MDNSIIVALITGGLALMGTIWSNRTAANDMDAKLDKQQAVMATELKALTKEVQMHNNFAQKIPAIETQIEEHNRRLTALERRG